MEYKSLACVFGNLPWQDSTRGQITSVRRVQPGNLAKANESICAEIWMRNTVDDLTEFKKLFKF